MIKQMQLFEDFSKLKNRARDIAQEALHLPGKHKVNAQYKKKNLKNRQH